MSTYVIGDVHGCFRTLTKLLKKLNYSAEKDEIIFIGDLVNRGRYSAEVLEFCISHKGINTVLGNHDIFLLKLLIEERKYKPLKSILSHPNRDQFYKWLIDKPLLINKNIKNEQFLLVHAGIPFCWSIAQAVDLAEKAKDYISDNLPISILNIWGNKPKTWNNNLSLEKQVRFTINCFTRMRFINNNGELDLTNTSAHATKGFRKWFDVFDFERENVSIVFGHWASLNGKTKNPKAFALDTGCVWGNRLTALCLEDLKKISVKVDHEDL
jgi:bis(5'-nucleosyl)-tetraphosphatase (symmetrical)